MSTAVGRLTRLIALGLTERQALVYLYFFDGVLRHGCQPTMREACREFGFASQTAAQCHLRALARKGWVESGRNRSRAVRFLKGPDGETFRGFSYREGEDRHANEEGQA